MNVLQPTMKITNIFSPNSLIWVALYLQWGVGLTESASVTIGLASSITSSSTTTLYTTSTPTTETWKVFAVGGYNHHWPGPDPEKIDPMKDDSNCDKPTHYPVDVHGSIAEMIGDQSIISCGGTLDGLSLKECYEYDQKSSNWTFVTNMINGRDTAASVVLGNDVMWITGGFNHGYLESTELYDVESKTFQTGPDLPQIMTHHCMTKLNETHVFIGGSDICYLVDTEKDPFVFKTLPEMFHERFGAGCGVVNMDLRTRNRFDDKEGSQSGLNNGIVMLGGRDKDVYARKDSEIYIIEDEAWIQGPLLPRGFEYGGSGNINDNSMIVAGGADEVGNIHDDIIMLNPTSMEFETLPGRLRMTRELFGMTILIDNEDC